MADPLSVGAAVGKVALTEATKQAVSEIGKEIATNAKKEITSQIKKQIAEKVTSEALDSVARNSDNEESKRISRALNRVKLDSKTPEKMPSTSVSSDDDAIHLRGGGNSIDDIDLLAGASESTGEVLAESAKKLFGGVAAEVGNEAVQNSDNEVTGHLTDAGKHIKVAIPPKGEMMPSTEDGDGINEQQTIDNIDLHYPPTDAFHAEDHPDIKLMPTDSPIDNLGKRNDSEFPAYGILDHLIHIPEFDRKIQETMPYGIVWINDRPKVETVEETNATIEYKPVEVINPETGEIETHYFPDFSEVAVPPGTEFDLPETEWGKSHATHETLCNKQLNEWCQAHPDEAKKIFSEEQLDQISKGKTPKGYTWHHTERSGKMQLVPTKIHMENRHTGGQAIWGNKVVNSGKH